MAIGGVERYAGLCCSDHNIHLPITNTVHAQKFHNSVPITGFRGFLAVQENVKGLIVRLHVPDIHKFVLQA